MGAERSLKGAEAVFLALLTIGLMGLLFLIIYGNLSGNLGFASQTIERVNETSYEITTTTQTLTNGASTDGFISLSVSTVWNLTNATGTAGTGYVIDSGNYTVDSTAGTVVGSGSLTQNYTSVNITYVVTYKGVSERNSDSVIGNLTSGATQFFTFSNVWFILTAITILIGIVLGVITLVKKSSGGSMVGKKGRSEFAS